VTEAVHRLLALSSASRTRAVLSVLLGAATVLCGVGLMAAAGYLISRAAEHPPVLSLTVAIVAVRFFGLARPLARYLERLASHDVALRSLARLRTHVYERVEPLAPAQLAGDRRGDVLARVVADVDGLQSLRLRVVGPALVALVAGVACVAVEAVVLPVAGVVLAAGLVVGGIAVPAAAAILGRRAGAAQAGLRGELSAELVELLQGAPELVVYGREDDALARVRAGDRALVAASRRHAFAGGVGEGLTLLVTGVTIAGVLAVSAAAHVRGDLDGVLVALLTLLALASFEAVQPLADAGRELSATLAAGRRVLELIDRESAIVDPERPAQLPTWPFTVALENVRARDRAAGGPVLDGVSLRLEPGRRVAVVGESGAGKTTIAELLLRFLDPDGGRVTLAGRDLREYRQEDVRRAIAVAGQDAHIFSTSIRDNVRLARPDATDDEIEEVLRRTRILDWVETLPDGLDTLAGEEGRELSGGQRQRIALARALLADAPVLVLDEPTSHLDPTTAEELMEDVLEATAGRTVLLITHRPEGLGQMDEVVRLDVSGISRR
jgi:ATP-binding cassette subfamily C protein CydC/ATP-binding cassette subfamily C protein CydCD